MSHFVIVPDSVSSAINARLDSAYVECPDAAIDREHHYHALLSHFNDTGVIADFSLEKKVPA